MRRRWIAPLGVSTALALAACDGAPKKENAALPATTATPPMPETAEPTGDAISATEDATPAASNALDDDTMTIDDTAQGAANVVRHYYADLDHGNFRAAYERWGNGGQDSHQSFADFKRGFAETAATSVEVGTPGNGGGAAGSTYIDVPVTVHARLKDGTRQRFAGHYTLRRVNDVPGSTQAERRWHLYSAALAPR
jgi:hypothetical protein